MGSVPIPRTWVTGEVGDGATMTTEFRDAVNFLLSPPRAVVTSLNSSFSVVPSNFQLISGWDTAVTDSDGMWSASQPSRLTCRTPGLWELIAYLHYPDSADGNYAIGIALNNAGGAWTGGPGNKVEDDLRRGTDTSGLGTSCMIAVQQYLNVGDYIEAYAGQTTASTQVIPNNLYSAQFSALWVAST